MNWFRTIRVAVLLVVLVVVAGTAWLDGVRSTRWREPLFVAIYPIAADDSPVTRSYVDSLEPGQFKAIDEFFAGQAQRFRLRTGEPIRTRLQPELKARPPQRAPGAGALGTIAWSLRLRFWAWDISRRAREPQDVRVFVLYHDPSLTPTVPHSLGLTKGLIGIVYAFADPVMTDTNDVVIAHELMHTVGATDKYDPANDEPRFPDGFADPQQVPLYPQRAAELMAGRRMIDAKRWVQPTSLGEVVLGRATAAEIRWPQP